MKSESKAIKVLILVHNTDPIEFDTPMCMRNQSLRGLTVKEMSIVQMHTKPQLQPKSKQRQLKSISRKNVETKPSKPKYCPAGLVDVRKKKTVEVNANPLGLKRVSDSLNKSRIKKTATLRAADNIKSLSFRSMFGADF